MQLWQWKKEYNLLILQHNHCLLLWIMQKIVNKSMAEIAQASDNQAVAAAEITEGINQIAEVVESNSATSQESAAASEELSSQADMLKDLVERFQYES